MNTKRNLVIVDYNLTRFLDVKMMTRHAWDKHGCGTILIRPNPQAHDAEVAHHIIDLDPRGEDFIGKATTALEPFLNTIVAVLPFSDNAVKTGAALAENLGKAADSSELAQSAYSKISYRQQEEKLARLFQAQGVFTPQFQVVFDELQLKVFAARCKNGFVLKPSCEGNNRGVLRLSKDSNLEEAFEEVKPYLKDGLICEELIDFEEEYSFDGIGHLNWVTEKISLSTRYPVEKGQIVPAVKSLGTISAVKRGGRLANILVGQKNGPFHNELKYDPVTGRSAVIEPNRRPAGMKIWHLAERVYGINFFHLLVDQLITGELPEQLPQPRGVAAIRELMAPHEGILAQEVSNPEFAGELFNKIKDRFPVNLTWSEFRITAMPGSMVTTTPKDNSGFMAEVCLYSRDSQIDVKFWLDEFEKVFGEFIAAYIQKEKVKK